MLYFCCFYNNIDIFILCEIHKKGIIRFGTYTISLMIPYDFFIKLYSMTLENFVDFCRKIYYNSLYMREQLEGNLKIV